MIFKSKKLLLRLFTIAIMAATIGIMYPGYQASAGTELQCLENCGSTHQTIEQCYQQAICKKSCRKAACDQAFLNDCGRTIGAYLSSGCPNCCDQRTYENWRSCTAAADRSHRAAISLCDRLYWEHCPSPE